MGSPEDEEGRSDDEGPQHRVRLRHRFEVGKYPVTFDEFDWAVKNGLEGFRYSKEPGDEGWGRGNRPVIYVSWDDAQAYIAWLSCHTGKTFRLLSEAEWEYCCRAGTTTRYYFGDEIKKRQANYLNWQTEPVTYFQTNPFGLSGMHGNVLEWCQDCWHDNYESAPTNGSAWEEGGETNRRVLRGGSWNYVPRLLRSAKRYWFNRDGRNMIGGFRVARTL